MQFVELVVIAAALQFFCAMTGREPSKSGLKAPAIAGDVGFERL